MYLTRYSAIIQFLYRYDELHDGINTYILECVLRIFFSFSTLKMSLVKYKNELHERRGPTNELSIRKFKEDDPI